MATLSGCCDRLITGRILAVQGQSGKVSCTSAGWQWIWQSCGGFASWALGFWLSLKLRVQATTRCAAVHAWGGQISHCGWRFQGLVPKLRTLTFGVLGAGHGICEHKGSPLLSWNWDTASWDWTKRDDPAFNWELRPLQSCQTARSL